MIEAFGRAGNTFAWLAFRSAQPRPVRLAHHTHAAAQVITAVRWDIPTLVIVRAPDDSALAHMVLRGVSARSALAAWIRYHRRIMTVRHGFVAAAFDDVTHGYGAVLRRVNEAFGTTFDVFEHTAENQARVFDEISERNRIVRGEQMTRCGRAQTGCMPRSSAPRSPNRPRPPYGQSARGSRADPDAGGPAAAYPEA